MKERNVHRSLTLLRIAVGIIFALHGFIKLFLPDGFGRTVESFSAMGLPFPAYLALAVSITEFVGGVFLIIGIASRWASLALLIETAIAFIKVQLKYGIIFTLTRYHQKDALFVVRDVYGYEFPLLLIFILIVIFINSKRDIKNARTKTFSSN